MTGLVYEKKLNRFVSSDVSWKKSVYMYHILNYIADTNLPMLVNIKSFMSQKSLDVFED